MTKSSASKKIVLRGKDRAKAAEKPKPKPRIKSLASLVEARVARAAKALEKNAELKRVFESLQELVKDATKSEADLRYKIGAKVAKVKADPDTYGKRAVATLAELLGYDDAVLYDYAKVTEVWPSKAEVTEILGRTTARGSTLSFSHLVELARVAETRRRSSLLEKAIGEGWTVRQLEQAIDPRVGANDDDEPEVRTMRVALKAIESAIPQMRTRTDRLLDHAKKNTSKDVLKLMEQSANAQRAFAEEAAKCAEDLENAHKKLTAKG